jgi:hypothetical protein
MEPCISSQNPAVDVVDLLSLRCDPVFHRIGKLAAAASEPLDEEPSHQ